MAATWATSATKAAIFVYKIRLHTASLFVLRADGLLLSTHGLTRVGPVDVDERASRGFHVELWRDGELGYALVSDVNRDDLRALVAQVAAKD